MWKLHCCCQLLICVWLFATPWTAACQTSVSFTIFWSLLKLMSIESLMLSSHLILCCPLFLLPLLFPSIKVFSSESSSVQSSHSVISDSLWPHGCSTPGFPVCHQLRSLLKLMSIKSVMPSNHLILCHPLLLLPSIFPSIRVFSDESVLHIRWPKDWSFSFSTSPSNDIQGWFPLGLAGLIFLLFKGI